MITNFKLFENIDSKFWVVKNDEKIKIRLFKIGIPDETIEDMMLQLLTTYKTDSYFYIGYDYFEGWTYFKYNYTSDQNLYKEDNYEFMGHVDINDVDIYNYEIRDEIKKYNL